MGDRRHAYDDSTRAAVYRVIAERRDVRHFLPTPIEPETLRRLLEAAHMAPSVGLTQPWCFVRITSSELRQAIHAIVQEERSRQATLLDDRAAEFLRLKVEGIRECGELIVAAVRDGATDEVFGRRSLPEMDLASVACAIENLWLAARAEGLGMGWVSMFEPQALARLLGMPSSVRPIAILCLGMVEEFYPAPMLVMQRWRQPRALQDLVREDRWSDAEAPAVGGARLRT